MAHLRHPVHVAGGGLGRPVPDSVLRDAAWVYPNPNPNPNPNANANPNANPNPNPNAKPNPNLRDAAQHEALALVAIDEARVRGDLQVVEGLGIGLGLGLGLGLG